MPLEPLRFAPAPEGPIKPPLKIHLYVIQAGTAYKIGLSTNPQARINMIRVCNPEEIHIISVTLIANWWTAAERIEKELHTLFVEKHIRGEWFRLTPEDLETIRVYLAERAA